jgi:hypothetical protein
VYCWAGDRVLFAESKRRRRDRIRSTQVAFLEVALATSYQPDDLLVVEWDLASGSADRVAPRWVVGPGTAPAAGLER